MQINKINFENRTETIKTDKNTIKEHYENNALLRRVEYDEFSRDIDAKEYNKFGIIISHQHKEYYETPNEKGMIETYKDNYMQYIRKSCTKITDGIKHIIDDYRSLTSPDKSYVNDFVHDKTGKLIKIIQNGIEKQI